MLISADTNYAIVQDVQAAQPLRRGESGEYRGRTQDGRHSYRAQVGGLQTVAYRPSLSGSFDRNNGQSISVGEMAVRSVATELRQQAASSFNSVRIDADHSAAGYLSVPVALITGFLTAVAAFTMVLRRPYWG